jgi:hypothetical protein
VRQGGSSPEGREELAPAERKRAPCGFRVDAESGEAGGEWEGLPVGGEPGGDGGEGGALIVPSLLLFLWYTARSFVRFRCAIVNMVSSIISQKLL